MTFNPYTYKGSENVQVGDGYAVMFVGFMIFLGISVIILFIGPPMNVKGDTFKWRNTFVSWFHADIISVGVLYCLLYKWEMFNDMIVYCDSDMYYVVAFSLGYFSYDFLDYLVSRKMFSNYEVILHHVGVIWSFWYTVHYRVNVPYTIIALMVEVNSIFLHGRKLMQFNKWPFDHMMYKLIIFLNLVTFVIFRVGGIVAIGVAMFVEWQRMTTTYCVFLIVTMFIMYAINPILFWRLFKNDVLRNIRHLKPKVMHNGVADKIIKNGHME